MDTQPGVARQSLTEQVATEVRVAMARAGIRQSDLARKLGRNDQWLSVRLRGVQPIDVNDLEVIAAGLGVSVASLLPDVAREVLDVEEIRSRPLRSRPVRHSRSMTRVQPTDDYPAAAGRLTGGGPMGRRPNRPGDGRPKGRPGKSLPEPTTRRPSRLPSPAVNMIVSSGSRSGSHPTTAQRETVTTHPVLAGVQEVHDALHG